MNEARYWKARGHQGVLLYNIHTNAMNESLRGSQNSNFLTDKQTTELYNNREAIRKLDSSIYSYQRQSEVGNDFARRQNQTLFLLKLFLTYMLILFIPLLVKRSVGDSFPNRYVFIIMVFVTIPFVYILGWNLYSVRNRSNMRWPLRNWNMAKLPAGGNNPSTPTSPVCTPGPSDRAQIIQEAEELRSDIEEKQKDIATKKQVYQAVVKDDKAYIEDDFKKLDVLMKHAAKEGVQIPNSVYKGGSITI